MKVECTIEAQSFDGIIPALNAGKFDAIMAGMSATAKREEVMAFTQAYGTTGQTFAVLKTEPARNLPLKAKVFSLATNEAGAAAAVEELKPLLKGKTIGVQGSSIAANFLDKYLKGTAEIREYKTTEQHDLDLTAGRIDAIMASTAYLSGAAGKPGNEEMTLVGPRFQGGMLGRGSSVGLRKSDPELKAHVRQGHHRSEGRRDDREALDEVFWVRRHAALSGMTNFKRNVRFHRGAGVKITPAPRCVCDQRCYAAGHALLQGRFPGERVSDDGLEIVQSGFPSKRLLNSLSSRDQHRRIARAPVLQACFEVDAGNPLYRLDDLQHGKAAAVAAIESCACPTSSQIVEREHVGMCEIRDVDIVSQAGSVGRRVIRSEDVEMAALAKSRLRRHLDEMRRPLAGLPAAALRIGACHIEVAEHHIVQRMGSGRVPQHQLGHELRGAIGRDWIERRGFPDRVFLGVAIDRRRRREDEPADLVADGGPDQGMRLHRIVEIIAQGIGDGIRHDDRARKMRDGIDAVLLDDLGTRPSSPQSPLMKCALA